MHSLQFCVPRCRGAARAAAVVAVVAVVAASMGAAPATGAAQTSDSTRRDSTRTDSLTTLSKVFDAVQAEKGKAVYELACLSCHKPVEHTGPKFWSLIEGQTLGEFFAYLKREMPQDNPGGISDDDYRNVMAYILQLNAMPPGEKPLAGDSASLAKIRIVAPPPPDTVRKGTRR